MSLVGAHEVSLGAVIIMGTACIHTRRPLILFAQFTEEETEPRSAC